MMAPCKKGAPALVRQPGAWPTGKGRLEQACVRSERVRVASCGPWDVQAPLLRSQASGDEAAASQGNRPPARLLGAGVRERGYGPRLVRCALSTVEAVRRSATSFGRTSAYLSSRWVRPGPQRSAVVQSSLPSMAAVRRSADHQAPIAYCPSWRISLSGRFVRSPLNGAGSLRHALSAPEEARRCDGQVVGASQAIVRNVRPVVRSRTGSRAEVLQQEVQAQWSDRWQREQAHLGRQAGRGPRLAVLAMRRLGGPDAVLAERTCRFSRPRPGHIVGRHGRLVKPASGASHLQCQQGSV